MKEVQLEKEFLEKINRLYGDAGALEINKAFLFASKKHEGQKRNSGDDYILHPYEVAKILLEYNADKETIICAFLHDCLERTDTSVKEIKEVFGDVVCHILQGLEKIEAVKRAFVRNGEDAENLRKMLLAMGSDTRIAFVKLSERLHNMQTLSYKTEEKQQKIAKETLELYVPLAERLGMGVFKRQMEDLCFYYLYPDDYKFVYNYMDDYCKKSEHMVADIAKALKQLALDNNIEIRVQSRKKSGFSLFKKIHEKGLENIFDIVAHRIIAKTVQDCYAMLGAIHEKWKPIEGRIKDYIAHPKSNLYMSLHTTVLYKTQNGDVPFEIQIRTEEMHNYCEYGIAAHWIYKEKGVSAIKNQTKTKELRKALIKDSEKIIEEAEEDFIENINKGFYQDKIFVFAPDLKVIELPKGSIPIDFAYNIHSNLGNRCVGAKVNGKMVPLTTKLQTGDNIEIITSSTSKGPSRDWLKIVCSREASSKIRAYFKKEKREENIKIGKEILEDYARRNGFVLSKLFDDKELLSETMSKYRLDSIEDVYAVVGYGGLTSSQVLSKFILKQKQVEKQQKTIKKIQTKTDGDGVLIGGFGDLLKKFAKCCNPIPGDEIVGYVSRGKGVTIHRKDCPGMLFAEEGRIISAEWAEDIKPELYNASIKIVAKNTIGIANVVSNRIAENKVDITFIDMDKSAKSEDVLISVGVRISSRKQLVEIINKLRAMNEVYDVYR